MMNHERALASIRAIKALHPHPNADRLELAEVDGWQVVVMKGKHNKGDSVVYFEVDSFLPVKPEFEFLRKGTYRNTTHIGEGFRIRTIKLRKQLSQGLIMTPEEVGIAVGLPIGTDVTETLEVKKYEAPIPTCLVGLAKGMFPAFIPKTDQERVQNLDLATMYDEYEVTMKLDGSSNTLYSQTNGSTGVCSRNIELKVCEDNSKNLFVKSYNNHIDKLKNIQEHLGFSVALQGELMGCGLQGDREGFGNDLRFFVYDIFNIDEQAYIGALERRELCKKFGLDHVPYMGNYTLNSCTKLEDLLQMADTKSINHNISEGLVFKCLTDPSKTFKVINNRFLLKED